MPVQTLLDSVQLRIHEAITANQLELLNTPLLMIAGSKADTLYMTELDQLVERWAELDA